ncbi:MAG: 30S ribosomal protein S6 [Saccharofermentanales bacterium]|jgi:small subunit ribosomal protein S6|nr:30S ribosomal protein S6 [Bacillota bacterium]
MRTYELMYVLNPAIGEEAIENEMKRIQDILETQGKIINIDVWGRRKLAYEIQDEQEGYYVLVHFESEPDFPKEVERLLKISDSVLRYLTVLYEGQKLAERT